MEGRLLIAEDDPNMGRLLEANLRAAGYAAHLALDGLAAKALFNNAAFDLCLLDIMLPRKDGFELAREIREARPDVPIIFLTARAQNPDKLKGFRIGCDDYVTKPFELDELLCRIKAVLDRTMGPRHYVQQPLVFGDCVLNVFERRLTIRGTAIPLTEKEALVLHLLATNMERTVTRTFILRQVWGSDDPYHSKSLDVYLTRIRKYLRLDDRITLTNMRGHGYCLELE
jgi:DNA-binding response OmpR family regulator